MPPRTRTRAEKALKENIDAVVKSRMKSDGRVTKSSRKALADKTNSLSDDNASIDIPIKTSQKTLNRKRIKPNDTNEVRPKRERRLPPRYVENQTLKNLSNSKDSVSKQGSVTSKPATVTKKPAVKRNPIKTTEDAKSVTKPGTNVLSPSKEPNEKKASSKPQQVPITNFLINNETHPNKNSSVQSLAEKKSNDSLNVTSPFKTPSNDSENSFVAHRPKRVHRLPSRFEDHSISPNKFIPVQPCHASTPLLQKNKTVSRITQKVTPPKENDTKNNKDKRTNKQISKETNSRPTKAVININCSNSSTDKNSPDSNNNGKNKVLRPKRAVRTKLQTKPLSPVNKIKPFAKRLLDKSLSFRVLEDRKSSVEGQDVYEFTFDPNEEPTPKKKRKKPVKKRPTKPKTVVFKSNYNDNVSKALAKLKNKFKPTQTKSAQSNVKEIENHVKSTKNPAKPSESQVKPTENHVKQAENYVKSTENAKTLAAENVQKSQSISKPTNENIPQSNCSKYSANITPATPGMNETGTSIHASNYASVCVEDIAADFEFSDHVNDMDYSPVNSPQHQLISEHQETFPEPPEPNKSMDPVLNKDPLNLQEGISFFEDPPVASSSMNVSVRQPLASPWRVEFGALPMKWHSNTYVKPNMTPAVGCSYINSEVKKSKHIYTNIVSEQEPLPEIFENATPALKQTSIISFIKEVAERNANKKKRRHSQIFSKPFFNDAISTSNEAYKSPKKAKQTKDSTSNSSNNSNTSKSKENSNNLSNKSQSPEKKKKDKDCTYFGFDESENGDQENVSPVKVSPTPKTRTLRSRNVLQELNSQAVPLKAAIPGRTKPKLTSSEVVEQLNDQQKLAEEAQFPVKEIGKEPVDITVTDTNDPSWHEENEDSQSVHLFEDIYVVHHLKPHRKSYGKAKKVTFQQSADSHSDNQPARAEAESSDDDLADLSFRLPNIKETTKRVHKKKPKKLLTKKEEKEVEEWAAGFNSMCEDIDEFPLLVE